MDGYRERVAAALEAADTDCHTGCQPDPDRLADAVLAVRDEELERQLRRRDFARKRAEQAEAAIARVRALHQEAAISGICDKCSEPMDHGYIPWPCDTAKALDGGA